MLCLLLPQPHRDYLQGIKGSTPGFDVFSPSVIRILSFFSLFLFLCASLTAQTTESGLIQFSGVVMSSDSLRAVPYVTVYNSGNRHGAITNYQGFFSLIARPGDIIQFSCLGYKPKNYQIPDKLEANRYSIIQLLTTDTIHLAATVIYPWPGKAEFKDAFLALEVPDDYMDRAMKNLERQRLRDLGLTLMTDGNETTNYFFRQEARKYYYAGQPPPIQLFNVFAWQEFIQAWKRGDFKKRK